MLNYYCTWNAQNCARPDAVLEPSAEVFLGADGAIGSTFNFTLPLFNQIEAAYSALDIPKAQALQKHANNIMQALVSCSLFPSIKHILKTQGVDCGGCRKPFPTLTEAQKAYIERVVRENM